MSSINQYYQHGRYKASKDKSEQEKKDAQYQRKASIFLKVLPKKRYKNVLDAGCGDGRVAQIMGKYLGIRLYGVDISKKGVELAKKAGVKAKIADLSKKIPFKDNFFDLVISTEVLEHVIDPDTFLKEIHRILKPNGLLLLTTPNLSSWTNRFLFLLGIYPIFMEASTEAKVGYGFFSRFLYNQQLVGHIHVFNYLALRDIVKFHKFHIEGIIGSSVYFMAPSSKTVTLIYNSIDKVMARFPALSSDLVMLAKKRRKT